MITDSDYQQNISDCLPMFSFPCLSFYNHFGSFSWVDLTVVGAIWIGLSWVGPVASRRHNGNGGYDIPYDGYDIP